SWKPAALNVLERRIFVVVAGVHIQELTSGPTVDRVSCQTTTDGVSVDLSAVDSAGMVNCTITGKNLSKDKVASIKLKLDDSTTKTGTIAPAADGNSATIAFKSSDFDGISRDFELFLTDSAGNDIDAKQKLKFTVRVPSFTSVYSAGSILKVTLRGSNLDR